MNDSIRPKQLISGTLFTFLLCFFNLSLFAQVKDAELWENVTIDKKLSRRYTLHFNQEGRITNNVSQFRYVYGDFGITRNLNKNFKFMLDYVLVWKKTDTRVNWRHQWYVCLTYKTKIFDRFSFSLREMYQQQYQDIYSSELGPYAENYLRSKSTLEYELKTYPFYKFKPYLASELYYHMDNNNKYGPQFDRIRYFAGVYYIFNKRSDLEFYYLFEKNFNVNNPALNYVTGIGFEHEF